MLDKKIEQQILNAVDENFESQVQFTQDLVRFPSVRGAEQSAQNFMAKAMQERDLSVDRWAIDIEKIKDHPGFSPVTVSYDAAYNVVGTYQPRENKGKSLILNGHIDVVPVGPKDMWSNPPFDPVIKDGWMYGRGAADMKAGLVANLFAFDALKKSEVQPAAPIYFQSVTEEECTGNGSLDCLARGYKADAALIPEPTGESLTRTNEGVLWFQVEVRGWPAHVSVSTAGNNAIVASYRIIEALQELEREWNSRKGQHPHFEDVEKPITINVGKIQGGDWASSVPAWCTIDCRAAIYPGVKVKDAQEEIAACVQKACKGDAFLEKSPPNILYNGFTCEGYELTKGSLAEKTLREAHSRVFTKSLEDYACLAYLDARVFALYEQIPALVFGPIWERIHGFDERVSLESTRQVTKTIALFIAEWCGIEPSLKNP